MSREISKGKYEGYGGLNISFILAEANFNRRCPTKAGGSTPFILDEANFNRR